MRQEECAYGAEPTFIFFPLLRGHFFYSQNLAGRPGFEPGYRRPERRGLPLADLPLLIKLLSAGPTESEKI